MVQSQVTFIVHGVGAPKGTGGCDADPSFTAFAAKWAARNGRTLNRIAHLVQPQIGPPTEFSILEDQLPDGRHHYFVELRWSDLSRAAPGFRGVIATFFTVLFGLRHIVRGTVGVDERPTLICRLSLDILSWLRGPITAI